MALFRVPFPDDPERRHALFARALAALSRHGTCEGDADSGTFRGSTPVGGLAGRYKFLEGRGELEIELTHKPWLVTTSMIEHEVRKFLSRV